MSEDEPKEGGLMFKIDVDKILPVTDARSSISAVVDEVMKGNTYVLTRGGRPAVAVIPVSMLKDVKGISKLPVLQKDEKIEIVAKNDLQTLDRKAENNTDLLSTNSNEILPANYNNQSQNLPVLDVDKIDQAVSEYEQASQI